MCFICSSGRLRKRVAMIIRSASLIASRPGMLLLIFGIDRAVLGVDGEQDGTLEAMMLGEDFAELRQRFLGTVFLVAADKHDVLALAGAVDAVVNDPLVAGPTREREAAKKRNNGEKTGQLLHGHDESLDSGRRESLIVSIWPRGAVVMSNVRNHPAGTVDVEVGQSEIVIQ